MPMSSPAGADSLRPQIEGRLLALYAARCMRDKGGEQIAVLALPPGRALFDFVVIAEGRSERQTATLASEVYHFCKRHQIHHQPVEGAVGWRVVDCFDVIVHAMLAPMRSYYALDELWKDAESLEDLESLLDALPSLDDERAAVE